MDSVIINHEDVQTFNKLHSNIILLTGASCGFMFGTDVEASGPVERLVEWLGLRN